MAPSAFDIYQGPSGYVAVTNKVRRQILEALAARERQLPELVELTGRAKPTLSSVHLKELLAQGLVQERTHATDARKKVYRLAGKRIGTSDVPVEDLRGAVRHYVKASTPEKGLPLALSLQAIAAAPPVTEDSVLRGQAVALGDLAAVLVEPPAGRERVLAIVTLLEDQGLAQTATVDLDGPSLKLRPGPALEGIGAARMRVLLEGLLEGLWQAGEDGGPVVARGRGTAVTYVLDRR